jgi:hypothetical protein
MYGNYSNHDRLWKKYGRLRSPFFSVYLRIRSRRYTIVIRDHVTRRKYGRIRSVYGIYTVDLGIKKDLYARCIMDQIIIQKNVSSIIHVIIMQFKIGQIDKIYTSFLLIIALYSEEIFI